MRHDLSEVAEAGFEEVLHCLGVISDVLLLHELVLRVLDQLTETYHEAPRVRATALEPLKENGADLLLDDLLAGLGENEEDDACAVDSVSVRESKLVDDRVQEAESGLVVELVNNLLESVSVLDAWLLLASL